ncbi:myosin class II heavy chain [Ostreococcus tauri]|uniref:Myosin class II heavy chain n=1 Tax=Ostreococcus tauri TaxID=70448 RepID=A0A1Y5IFB8_OSTTA|nr:myosin class II heavy chain [Ostreococcus tauri]
MDRARALWRAGVTGGPPPPGVGTIRTLPHARAQTFPLRESAATVKTATAKTAKTAKAKTATVKTAKAKTATVKTAKATVKTVKTVKAKAKTVKTPVKTAKAKAPAKTKAAPEAATAPEAPIGVNRTLPHASAQKFPLHESVTSSAGATTPGAAETAVLLSPLSRPAGAATEASASSAASGSGFGDRAGPSRSSLLAAVGVVLVALAAFSANSLDEEDMPPPPRRGKPASAGARKEVDVQIEIVKQPELKELQKEAKKVPERESAGESSRVPEQKGVEASEFADALGATAEFLANVECFRPLLICRGYQYRERTFHGPTLNASSARTHANRASGAAGVLRVVASPRLVPLPQKDEREHNETEVVARVSVPTPPTREDAIIMDASKGLSATALIEEAYKTLSESLTDDEKKALHEGMKVQSESDVKLFKDLSASMINNFEKVVNAERSVTDELIAAINVLEGRVDEAFRRVEQEKTQAAADKEQALKSQETRMKAEHADFLVAERIERIKALDNERMKIGALREVLTKRRKALERAYDVQSLELAVMDLGSRLDNGEAFADVLVLLKTCAEKDGFVGAIIRSVNEKAAEKGVATRLQLAEQLSEVRETARKLSLVPEGGGGLLAHGLSHIASWIRVKDTAEEGAQGIEGAIAQAESFLAAGELMKAANALSKAAEGSKAATSVAKWVYNVRSRAEAEQMQAALNAHAQCQAAALI